MKYTYTLKMMETTTPRSTWSRWISMWEYWSWYGKMDQIILNPNPEDYEFTIWPNYTEYGYDYLSK